MNARPALSCFSPKPQPTARNPWTNEENDRIAVSGLYNQVDGGWAPTQEPHPNMFEAMPPIRQTLFRGRYVAGNVTGADFNRLY